jgi:hypothetical protein
MNTHAHLKLDLKRHPQNANSADVIMGFRNSNRSNHTTNVLNCNGLLLHSHGFPKVGQVSGKPGPGGQHSTVWQKGGNGIQI